MPGGRLVVMTNETAQIKGDCIADGVYKDQIKLDSAILSAGSSVTLDDGANWAGNVAASNVLVTLENAGAWIAELQQALFAGTQLGKVTITELSQTGSTYAKVREIILADAWFSTMQVAISGTVTSVSLDISYSTCTVNWGDKVAFFHPEGKYA